MSLQLQLKYKKREQEMLNTCKSQSHKRSRLIFEMQEIQREIKKQ